ncbi:hypothetical protein [Kamptonema sp. UHCC 0994]|uniref:hypothetical protein n=1 Tax=Kamptonema sp. UHCC 0994 TaxID=3031329 RepID=UPI0023B8FC27|nr:hypothetical protein [Kamptonema sp. UHCC 0994]MDF0553200.1 hypothetical protein [Kamptonema sp. UHCC 0994]
MESFLLPESSIGEPSYLNNADVFISLEGRNYMFAAVNWKHKLPKRQSYGYIDSKGLKCYFAAGDSFPIYKPGQIFLEMGRLY